MTKEDIHNICLKYDIENYTINEDLSIDVEGDVSLCYRRLKKLPLRFRNVTGSFDCSHNYLTSLEGVPSSINRYFSCSFNHLTFLEGYPSYVGGIFYSTGNPLESLKGIPLNLTINKLFLPKGFTYSDYLAYCRDLKFKKLLK